MKSEKLVEEIAIPDGITFNIDNGLVCVKGRKGEVRKKLMDPSIDIKEDKGKVMISAKKSTRREKTKIGTFKAHIKNMFKGATEGHIYKLKICAAHFPMNVSASNKEFIVKNFLGEKVPRKISLKDNVNVKVDGDTVIVESVDKNLASQTAADIEQLCRITNRDRRIFQDGIWLFNKDGKDIK
jgi:large subunit ribosomal protein L6